VPASLCLRPSLEEPRRAARHTGVLTVGDNHPSNTPPSERTDRRDFFLEPVPLVDRHTWPPPRKEIRVSCRLESRTNIDNVRLPVATVAEPRCTIDELAEPGFEQHLRYTASLSTPLPVFAREPSIERGTGAHPTTQINIFVAKPIAEANRLDTLIGPLVERDVLAPVLGWRGKGQPGVLTRHGKICAKALPEQARCEELRVREALDDDAIVKGNFAQARGLAHGTGPR
jgi:hypothetical protein